MLLALALALPLQTAWAADPGDTFAASNGMTMGSASPSSSDKKSGDKKSSSTSDSKSSGVSDSEGKIFKTFKIGTWKVKPYVSPGGGVQINGSDLSGVVGVDAGFKYWHKKWAGDLYAGGSGTSDVGGGTTGYDVHLGDETGARLKYWGATLGLVGAYNGYVFADGTSIAPALTASVPVKVIVGPKKYHIAVGIAPSLTSDKSRHVDWSKTNAIGFGDEFAWTVAAAVKFKALSAKFTFTQNVYGDNGRAIVTNTPTLSIGLGDIIQVAQ